jgi:hypothetical protein
VLLVRPADPGYVLAHGKYALEVVVALSVRGRDLPIRVQVHDHSAVVRMDFLLQVLHELPVNVPELVGEYVISIISVNEDYIVLVAVGGNEILGICYVEENAVMYTTS